MSDLVKSASATDRPALPATPFPAGFLEHIAHGASERDARKEHPFEIIAELKALKFGARRLPVSLGGAGASLTDGFAAAIELATADPNVAHIWRNHHVSLERIFLHPTTHPHLLKLRERAAAGDLFGIASTELGHPRIGGPLPLFTTLSKSGSGYVLNGRKSFTTGAMYSDWISITATHEDGSRVTVVLPRTREGIDTTDDWDGMGQRLTGSGSTVLRDVHVAPDEILTSKDLPASRHILGSCIAQLFLTSVITGIIESVSRDATALLSNRKRNFYYAPTPSGTDDPLLLAALGERAADAFAARATVLAAAASFDRAADSIAAEEPDALVRVEEAAAAAAKAKIVVDRLGHQAGTALFDLGGGSATRAAENFDRHWRNIRTISTHNPTSHKAYALGNLTINDQRLPTHGFF